MQMRARTRTRVSTRMYIMHAFYSMIRFAVCVRARHPKCTCCHATAAAAAARPYV
jgi:hypothetical protein